MSQVHPQARTTPRTRAEIKASAAPVTELAERYNITVATARKWKSRETPEDLSHRPRKLSTTLSPSQEAIVVELRRMLLLPLDDLLVVTREFINAQVSRSGLDRCLQRHGVGSLREIQAALAGDQTVPPKSFKDYEPGFVHVDIKYLPQMPDEKARRYLFVAIDRATRWVYLRIYAHQDEAASIDFLRRLHQAAPMKIKTVLTDNGSQFTDRFTSKTRAPSGQHAFDRRCVELGIEHRLCPPRHPQTNGMVERFNGRVSEVIAQTRFKSAQELETTLTNYLATYNHRIPQRALNHLSPVQALKQWQAKRPELFSKRVYELSGLDTYPVVPRRTEGERCFRKGPDDCWQGRRECCAAVQLAQPRARSSRWFDPDQEGLARNERHMATLARSNAQRALNAGYRVPASIPRWQNAAHPVRYRSNESQRSLRRCLCRAICWRGWHCVAIAAKWRYDRGLAK